MKLLQRKHKTQTATSRRSNIDGTRAPVFSYYAGQKRAQQLTGSARGAGQQRFADNSQPKKRYGFGARHTFAWKHLPTYVACLMFVSAFVYVLSLSSDPRVVVEQRPGIVQRDEATYATEVKSLWNRSIRNHSKITTDTISTRQAILENYRELADVRIQLPLVGRRATIVLVPAAPILQIQAQNGLYYVDNKGKALVDTSRVESTNSVPTVQDDSVLNVDPGKSVLPQYQVSLIVQLNAELRAANLSVQSLTLSDKSVNQLDVRLVGQAYYIKVQMEQDSDIRQIVGAYLAVRKKLDADNTRPGEYVDVRIPEKVFYK